MRKIVMLRPAKQTESEIQITVKNHKEKINKKNREKGGFLFKKK